MDEAGLSPDGYLAKAQAEEALQAILVDARRRASPAATEKIEATLGEKSRDRSAGGTVTGLVAEGRPRASPSRPLKRSSRVAQNAVAGLLAI